MNCLNVGSLAFTRSRRALSAAGLGLLLTAPLGGQQIPVRDGGAAPRWIGTASLSGNVLNDVTGQPLRRAVVTISNSERGLRLSSVTDDTGSFSFSEIPEGPISSALRSLDSFRRASVRRVPNGRARPSRLPQLNARQE